mmetsp:Transcript_2811/g.8256  ORF Transcript_2811/g.8256 Transcript_2811/m.8256 type:complete len:243 (-) Transcript_2811:379-1107(-)
MKGTRMALHPTTSRLWKRLMTQIASMFTGRSDAATMATTSSTWMSSMSGAVAVDMHRGTPSANLSEIHSVEGPVACLAHSLGAAGSATCSVTDPLEVAGLVAGSVAVRVAARSTVAPPPTRPTAALAAATPSPPLCGGAPGGQRRWRTLCTMVNKRQSPAPAALEVRGAPPPSHATLPAGRPPGNLCRAWMPLMRLPLTRSGRPGQDALPSRANSSRVAGVVVVVLVAKPQLVDVAAVVGST